MRRIKVWAGKVLNLRHGCLASLGWGRGLRHSLTRITTASFFLTFLILVGTM